MAANNKIHGRPCDSEPGDSPLSKRPRLNTTNSNETSRWSLTKDDVVLDSVYDSGLGRLDSYTETGPECKVTFSSDRKIDASSRPSEKFDISADQIAVLQAALPENTLQKLTFGEMNNILLKQNTLKEFSNDNINYFDLLSDEVILHIFQKLPKWCLKEVAQVSRRFSELVEDDSLWTHMDVSDRVLKEGALGVVISRQVVVLRAAKTHIDYPPILPNVKAFRDDFTSRLMLLDLTMASVATNSLVTIFEKCRRLKKLSLESVTVNDDVLMNLSENRDLEALNFSMSLGIRIQGLKYLLINCRKIRELNVSWTYLNLECIKYICDNLPVTLQRFNFAGCRKLLHDESVTRLVKNCPNLRELDLSDCTSITGESVKKIGNLAELNFLALSRCYNVPLRSLLQLKKSATLTYLDIHGNYIEENDLRFIKDGLGSSVNINKFKFSSVARPAVGTRKSYIWNMRVRL